MNKININERISFLRKEQKITQEELAQSLGVTNQAVSKWESGQCCPDIALLPDIASFFHVSIDDLMGYKQTDSFEGIFLKLKNLLDNATRQEVFDKSYRISMLLHEAICSKDNFIPWDTSQNLGLEKELKPWDFSSCTEPEGTTAMSNNGIFLSNGLLYTHPTSSRLHELKSLLNKFNNIQTLKVLFALYTLTFSDDDQYVSVSEIATKAHVSEDEVLQACEAFPTISIEDENGIERFRLEGCFMHIPALLLMLREK